MPAMANEFPPLPERIHQAVLSNGLTVVGIEKPGFVRHYAQLTVFFGSASARRLAPEQGGAALPAGVAHFLEHKMFDKGDHDAADAFAARGADVNAYTTRTITNYYCSGTGYLQENVQDLVNFVLTPYFTAATVAKEQGIISQEIQMYRDDPDYAVQQTLWDHLFPDSVIAEDVAGSRQSIAGITPAMLLGAYRTFYRPNNMQLTVVGDFNFPALLSRLTMPAAAAAPGTVPTSPAVTAPVLTTTPLLRTTGSLPEAWVGVRLPALPDPTRRLRVSLQLDLLLSGMLLESAPDFLRLYQSGLIDDSFLVDAELHSRFGTLTVGGKTSAPATLLKALRQILTPAHARAVITPAAFTHLQRELIGRNISGFDHFGWLGAQAVDAADTRAEDRRLGYSIPQIAAIIAALRRSDVLNLADDLFDPARITGILVSPSEQEADA